MVGLLVAKSRLKHDRSIGSKD